MLCGLFAFLFEAALYTPCMLCGLLPINILVLIYKKKKNIFCIYEMQFNALVVVLYVDSSGSLLEVSCFCLHITL